MHRALLDGGFGGLLMAADRDALFTAMALRMGHLQPAGLAGVYAPWKQSAKPLADYLEERGLIAPADRRAVEARLDQIASRHAGDAHSLWAEVADEKVRSVMTSLGHESFNPTVDLPSAGGGNFAGSFEFKVATQTEAGGMPGSLLDATIDSRPGGEQAGRFDQREAIPDSGENASLRYARTSLHAQGGVGQIWLARDATLGREVALKELRPEQVGNSIVRGRFLDEARITGQLEHPGIVPIYELARHPDDGRPFYTMRFVRGRTLSRAIRDYHEHRVAGEAKPLEFRGLLDALIAVCNAVAYAHARGIVHRDLKGQNVMLGDFGEVLVLDWGLAKPIVVSATPDGSGPREAVDPSKVATTPVLGAIVDAPTIELDQDRNETMQGQVLGTPAYMSPEQAEGKIEKIGPWSDVYSIGAILYELLSGQRPFAGAGTRELLRLVRERMPDAPRKLEPGAPAALEAVCLKAMALSAADRYATAGELADEMRRYLADEPVRAYREPWGVRAGRWARRHRTAVVAAAAIAGVGLPALAVGNLLVARQRDRARALEGVARAAVDDFYIEVADDWLEDRSDPRQDAFLRRAMAFYDGTGEASGPDLPEPRAASAPVAAEQARAAKASATYYERSADDPVTARTDAAEALVRVGDLRRRLGEFDAAEAAYTRAIERGGRPEAAARATAHRGALRAALGRSEAAEADLRSAIDAFDRVAETAPPALVAVLRVDQAAAETDLADLLKVLGRSTDSEALYARAIDRLASIVEAQPDEVRASRTLAVANDGLGVLLMILQRGDDARTRLERAAELLEPLVRRAPTVTRNREALAKTCNSLGLLLRKLGRTRESEARLGRALALYGRLAEDFPGRHEYRRAAARGRVNLALLLRDDGRTKEAEAEFRLAADEYEALLKLLPDVPKLQRDLAVTSFNQGAAAFSLARYEEALACFDRARRVALDLTTRHPGIPSYELISGVALRDSGAAMRSLGNLPEAATRLDEAARELDRLVAARPTEPAYADDLAQCLNLLGEALAAAERREEAEGSYRRAIALFEARLREAPGAVQVRTGLAEAMVNLAVLEPKDAPALQEESLAILAALHAERPGDRALTRSTGIARFNIADRLIASGDAAEAESHLVVSAETLAGLIPAEEAQPSPDPQLHFFTALAFTKLGELRAKDRPAEAVAPFEQAVKHARAAARGSTAPVFLEAARTAANGLVAVLAASGRVDEATRAALALPEVAPRKPELRVEAARLLARCIPVVERQEGGDDTSKAASRKGLMDRVIAQLRVAVDAGYRNDGLGAVADFDLLKPRDDFQAVVADASSASAASE